MGSQLVHQVAAMAKAGRLKGLSHADRLVLVGMALRARDSEGPTGKPGLHYWAGWEYLAVQWLGYPEYDDAGSAESGVARAIRHLRDEGLVEPVGRFGSSRGPVVYRLHLLLPE